MTLLKHALPVFLTVAFMAGTTVSGAIAAPKKTGQKAISIEKPWARASVGVTGPTAAFMVITNRASTPDRLIKARADFAGMVQIHQTVIKNDQAQMNHVGKIDIPAGGKAVLKPGSFHIMLMRLKKPVVKGTKVTLVLTFEKAGEVTVVADVLGHGSRGPKHSH